MKKNVKRSPTVNAGGRGESHSLPTPSKIRPLISLWLVVHFFTLCLALSANLIPSELQMRLLGAVGPYASSLNQAYGLLPFEMIQGSELDHHFLFQIHCADTEKNSWRAVLPGSNSTASQSPHSWKRFMRLSGMIATQEEHAIVAKLCEAAVQEFENRTKLPVDGVRLVRQVVPSFEQDLLISHGQREIIAGELQDDVLYQAKVVRFADGRIAFVPQTNATRAARSRSAEPDSPNSQVTSP